MKVSLLLPRLALSGLALALVATVSPTAQATPTPAPQPAAQALSVCDRPLSLAFRSGCGPKHTDYRKIPASDRAYIHLAARINAHAVTHPKHHRAVLNYAKANTYDLGHVTFRRKFAEGFRLAGGQVTHISSGELKKVKKTRPKGDPYKDLDKNSMGVKVCNGSNKVVVKSHMNFYKYYDSCKTALIIFAGGSIALLAGTLAGATGPAAPFVLAVALLVGLGAGWIAYLQQTSGYQAIYDHWRYFILSAHRQ